MKKSQKKKFQNIKPDGQAYTELVSEFERKEMADYSFKSNAQAMGKNAKKLRKNKIIRAVLSIIGAILVLYLGYFIVALIKGVNSRPQTSPSEYVVVTQEQTTVPSTQQTTVPVSKETTTAEKVSRAQEKTTQKASETTTQQTTTTKDSGL
ncbi:MAG: hypothetical protein IKE65_01595 [Clostridia bacterium]|nr:hypothetical protein [Clostridia bacterium]